MKLLKPIILIALLCITCSSFAQTTTVWIARHAEKDTTPGADPNLSPEGKTRADALAIQLKKEKIAAVFTTNYKRTSQTGEPSLKQANLPALITYNPADLPALAKQVLKEHAGRNVLIVGHSNTVIPTLQAFGGTKPFDTLTDDDYDILFKIIIATDGKASTVVKYYGDKHHTTVIP